MQRKKDLHDRETLSYYNSHAVESFHLYNSVSSPYKDHFQHFFPPHGRILDMGCGSGRDLLTLRELGYKAYGMDSSSGLLEQICKNAPGLNSFVKYGCLPGDIPDEYNKEYFWDGLLCSAVLQHIPDTQQPETMSAFYRLLKPGGLLLLTIPLRYPLKRRNRDKKGRLFHLRPAAEVISLLERNGFQVIDQRENGDSLTREGVLWANLVFEKKNTS